MKVVGITGKSGSGKSTVASLLARKLSCKHIDIDKIGHQALFQPEILDSLCEKFGKGILDKNGNIDRKKVGDIVFAQEDKMKELTDLTWGYMKSQLDLILSYQEDSIIILDWILLPISEFWEKCDFRILTIGNDDKRKIKILERDNITEEYFEKRDSASIDYLPFEFDYIFSNDYKNDTINKTIEQLVNKLSQIADI